MKKYRFILALTCLALTGCQKAAVMNITEDSALYDLLDLNEQKVMLSDLQGKKVYIKFWATWCPICLGGLEDVQALALEDHDFEFVTIVTPNANGEKDTDAFIDWFQGLGMDQLPVLLDENGNLAEALNVRGFPTSAFFDAGGNLIKVQPGHLDKDAITSFMDLIE